jgi:hypothetical protein
VLGGHRRLERWAAVRGVDTTGESLTEPAATTAWCQFPIRIPKWSMDGGLHAVGGEAATTTGYRSAVSPVGAVASASSTARSSAARANGFWTKANRRARAPSRTSTSSV